MKNHIVLAILLIIFSQSASAFKDEVLTVYSKTMDKDIPVTIVTPDSYDDLREFPVVYLLHGYSDNYRTWIERTDVESLSDLYEIIIVLPDGGYDSWYFDSRIAKDYQYETFITQELVSYIDNNYKTIRDRKGRAITGQSMGGHGALHCAFRHTDIYGSAGSLSGGVDIRPFPESWNIAGRLGSYKDNMELWSESTIINMTHLLKPGTLNIIIDCGTEDFFYEVNCNLHKKLMSEGILHDFYVRPGAHNWTYWRNAIKYQILFFSESFKYGTGC